MKKSMAVIAALLIGIYGCCQGIVAMAEPAGEGWEAGMDVPVSGGDIPVVSDSDADQLDPVDSAMAEESLPQVENQEQGMSDSPEMTCLQIPQKLVLVVDPWELDGRGQIYSDPYIIQNTGETIGILYLSFQCILQEEGNVTVTESEAGLHEREDKAFYAEVLFGDGNIVILSQEDTGYYVELEPGEELIFQFAGEVNENAANPWENGDIEIEATYSWETDREMAVMDAENDVAGEQSISGGDADPGVPDEESPGAEPDLTVSGNDLPEGELPEESGPEGQEYETDNLQNDGSMTENSPTGEVQEEKTGAENMPGEMSQAEESVPDIP